MILLLSLATAHAGGCTDVTAELVAIPEFQQSFRATTVESAKVGFLTSFVQAFTSQGLELTPDDERFIEAFWAPRVEQATIDLMPDYSSLLQHWVIESVGCKTLKQARRRVPVAGWEAIPPDGIERMQATAQAYMSDSDQAKALYQRFEAALEPHIVAFEAEATVRWPPAP